MKLSNQRITQGLVGLLLVIWTVLAFGVGRVSTPPAPPVNTSQSTPLSKLQSQPGTVQSVPPTETPKKQKRKANLPRPHKDVKPPVEVEELKPSPPPVRTALPDDTRLPNKTTSPSGEPQNPATPPGGGDGEYSPPPSVEEPPAAPEPATQVVHITRTGHKYHLAGCRYLSRSDIPISLSDAIAQGYEPCKICFGR